ncbi:MAG: sulfatase-like hydrolase/transferase [Planctomycetota bacterium]
MNALIVMFDSLNRRFLTPYGAEGVHAPNFERLAERTTVFDASYVCSMPCMPARRDFHTGRPNFLHRGWGPLEPFDDSAPQQLRDSGVGTHMITDHYHYFEDGGCTYHTRYDTWRFFRGQEGDPWMGQVQPIPPEPGAIAGNANENWDRAKQDRINRQFIVEEADWPSRKTFDAGVDFLRRNRGQTPWMLHIETFDPHEPFFAHDTFRQRYTKPGAAHDALQFDWPAYDFVRETPEQVEHVRNEYRAAVSMCDARLGQILDEMDAQDLWDNTLLVVWTDHGFMLGEHDAWAKVWLPFYEEIARTPLFIHDPRRPKPGQRRSSLVQPAIDLAPTLLQWFDKPVPADMLGRDLGPVVNDDTPIRDTAVFGVAGGQLNITDGRYVYMRKPDRGVDRHDYTLMPTDMHSFFNRNNLAQTRLADPMAFTKGVPTLRVPRPDRPGARPHPDVDRSLLFDLETDPGQLRPIDDPRLEARMTRALADHLVAMDAPEEVYRRFQIPTQAG